MVTTVYVFATDKCRLPFYGGCPFTRVCLSSALDVGCPSCISGFVEDPANPGGACLREFDVMVLVIEFLS